MDCLFTVRSAPGAHLRLHLSRVSSAILIFSSRSSRHLLRRSLRNHALHGSLQCQLQSYICPLADRLLSHFGLLSFHYGSYYLFQVSSFMCIWQPLCESCHYRWRTQWQDNWWKRLLCAFLLAGGVSSMHYCGVGGTSYYIRMDRITHLTSGRKTTSILSGGKGRTIT